MTEQKKTKWFAKSAAEDRLLFLGVFLGICIVFAFFWLVRQDFFGSNSAGGCAFKRNYGYPCPTCGWTTSICLFVKFRTINAIYTQPAAAISCIIMIFVAIFSLLSAASGVNFTFLPPVRLWRPGYIGLAALAILAIGWAETIVRTLAGLP